MRHAQRPAIYDETNGQFAFHPAVQSVGGGLSNSLRAGQSLELSARCNVENAVKTAISILGTFPRLKIGQSGRPGADCIELREVR